MRVVLVNPPFVVRDTIDVVVRPREVQPPIGLCYLAAIAQGLECETIVIDAVSEGIASEEVVNRVVGVEPAVVGFSCVSATAGIVKAMVAEIKVRLPSVTIVIGGSHPSAVGEADLSLWWGVDAVVVGEGERSWSWLLKELQGRKGPGCVVAKRINGPNGPLTFLRSPRIECLDALPDPAWGLLSDLEENYSVQFQACKAWPSMALVTSRGCRGQCAFCSRATFGNRVSAHSALRVWTMMTSLNRQFGIAGFLFDEDDFLIDTGRTDRFLEICTANGSPFPWSCLTRADKVSERLLSGMKAAGCWQVAFGVESGSDRILKSLRKGETSGVIRRGALAAKEVGLSVKGFFLMGAPGEDRASLNATIDFVSEVPFDEAVVSFFTPFPGTVDLDTLGLQGKLRSGYSMMDFYTPVFIPKDLTEEDLWDAAMRLKSIIDQRRLVNAKWSRPPGDHRSSERRTLMHSVM